MDRYKDLSDPIEDNVYWFILDLLSYINNLEYEYNSATGNNLNEYDRYNSDFGDIVDRYYNSKKITALEVTGDIIDSDISHTLQFYLPLKDESNISIGGILIFNGMQIEIKTIREVQTACNLMSLENSVLVKNNEI